MKLKGRYLTIVIILACSFLAFLDIRYAGGPWMSPIDEASFKIKGNIDTNKPPTASKVKTLVVPSGSAESVAFSNPFGSTTVRGTDGNDVTLRYTVKVYGENKADAIRYANMVKYKVIRTGDSISLTRNSIKTPRSIKGVAVDCTLGSPKGLNLAVENHYGTLDVAGFDAGAAVDNSFGRTTIRDIVGASTIENSYGDLEVVDIKGDTSVENGYGKTDVRDVDGKLVLETKYGACSVWNVSSLSVEGKYGDVRVSGVAGDVAAEVKYSPLVLEEVKGNVKVSSRYGNIDVNRAYSDIDVDGRASRVSLGVLGNGANGYRFDVLASKSRVHVSEDLGTEGSGLSNRDDESKFVGTLGDGKHLIKVRSSMGEVWLNRW